MENKKLKKLELKKQKIVDLSEQENFQVRAGEEGSFIVSFVAEVVTNTFEDSCFGYLCHYTHTGWSCGGCSTFPGDTVNCTACSC